MAVHAPEPETDPTDWAQVPWIGQLSHFCGVARLEGRTRVKLSIPAPPWTHPGSVVRARVTAVDEVAYRLHDPRRPRPAAEPVYHVPRAVILESHVCCERGPLGREYYVADVEALPAGPFWLASRYDVFVEPVAVDGDLNALGALADRLEEDGDPLAAAVRELQRRCDDMHPAGGAGIARRDIATLFGGSAHAA